MYQDFATRFENLSNELRSANHSVSLAFYMMEMDPSDRSIRDYEAALDYAARIRSAIGKNHEAEMRRRSIDAGI